MVSALTWAMRIPSRVRAIVSSALTALRSRSAYFIQQRRGDGVGQAIYGPVQRIIFHFKIKRGAVGRGTGVMTAAVQLKKLCKAVRLGIFCDPISVICSRKCASP